MRRLRRRLAYISGHAARSALVMILTPDCAALSSVNILVKHWNSTLG